MGADWTQEDLERCLEDLENRIDPDVEEDLCQQWRVFTDGDFQGDVFRPTRKRAVPPSFIWPKVSINQAQEDYVAMMLSEYRSCSYVIETGNRDFASVRPNYGTGILPSLFGVERFIMDESMETLPTTRPLPDRDAIRKAIAGGVPDLHTGLGERVFEATRRFVAIGEKYPKIGRYVRIYHPDLQGPMDVCELLWGSDLFLDIVDDPDLVHTFLQLITDTYIAFMREWSKMVPSLPGYTFHWGMMHGGQIMLRDDSAMNFSPAMFDEFIKPYDQQLLNAFGGGALHFCGRGDHYIESASQLEGLHAIAMSQPEYNNMETIYRHTVDKGLKLLRFSPDAVQAALMAGRDLHSCVESQESR